ncbi:MAG: BlaI/MecI/CopY family transcriptional regulator [Clostridium fessum]
MKNNYLSEREMNVMQVLWKYEKPMTVTEIVESEKELTTPTVHTVLENCLIRVMFRLLIQFRLEKFLLGDIKRKRLRMKK